MAFRLLRYLVRIWQRWLQDKPNAKRLPAIIPVVLHHSATGWTAATTFEHLLDLSDETRLAIAEHLVRFRFVLKDISHDTDETLRALAITALGRLALWCLRHAREPEQLVERLREWLELVREVHRAPNGSAALLVIWRYILAVSEPKRAPEEIVLRLLEAVGEEERTEIMTAADMLIERGRNQGQRAMLLKLLRSRFGTTLPEAVVAQVNAAGMAQLDAWFDRGLTAATLADVLSDC